MKLKNVFVPLVLCTALLVAEPAIFNATSAAAPMILSVPAVSTPAPSNLTAVSSARNLIGGGRADLVFLYWKDNSSNEYTFRVERCAGSTCKNFVEIAKLAHNTVRYIDTRLPYAPGKYYRYRVRANSPNGLSAYTNIVTVKLHL